MGPRRNQSDDLRDEEALAAASINTFRRLNRQTQTAVIVLLVVAGIVALVFYFHSAQFGGAPATDNLLLGNPSAATTNPGDRDNYLMVKPYYVLSYDSDKGTPNWVSWQVTSADLGNAPRKQTFDTDTTLPLGFNVVTSRDYVGGGFDRGHMCPHSDRAADQEMSFSTFVMTNIIPQAPSVNEKAWAQLESYCRDLVRQGNDLYVIAGPLGQGGIGKKGLKQTLAEGKVIVPAECWKVVVVVSAGGGDDDLPRISLGTRVIAVEMPNDNAVGEEWDQYRTSPAIIEQKTGLHFFDRVRPDIAAALRQKVDAVIIPRPRPMSYHHD